MLRQWNAWIKSLRYDRIEMKDQNINKLCNNKNSLSWTELLWRLPQIFTRHFAVLYFSLMPNAQKIELISNISWLAQNQLKGNIYNWINLIFLSPFTFAMEIAFVFFFFCFAIHGLVFASKGFNYYNFLHICNRKTFLLPALYLADSMHHIHTFIVHCWMHEAIQMICYTLSTLYDIRYTSYNHRYQ